MQNFLMMLVVLFFVACGQVESIQSKLTESHDSVTLQVEKQGIALSLAPATDVTYATATWQISNLAGEIVSSGDLVLGQENMIPIQYQGEYSILVRLTTTDGRNGIGQTWFTLGWNELKHILIKVALPPAAQGVGVSVETEIAPVLSFVRSGGSPIGISIPSQIEVFRMNVTVGIEYPLPTTLSELHFLISRSSATAYVVGCVLHDMENNIVMNFAHQYDYDSNGYDTSGSFPISSEIYTEGDVVLQPGVTKTLSLMCEVHAQPGDAIKAKLIGVNNSWQPSYVSGWPEGYTLTF